MKKTINGVIIVEGSNDASYISSLYDCLFVITNGYDIPKEERDFLINLPEEEKVYILTDSDEAGKNIREKLNKILQNPINLTVDIAKCNKKGKHGVAECDKEELMKVLDPYTSKECEIGNITLSDLINLGVDTTEKRNYLSNELHLGKCNNKILLKRINYLNIKETRIRALMERYGN
ncbi:MAG: DUF4093 domain-containing protein [Bacilli bacterium]|nr:DUF4093 domain-containing protein [Bacilli bacterium]